MENRRQNAVPKSYRAYHIEPGLADYTAEGVGVVLVPKEALDEMNPSFVGMPVVNMEHTDKTPEELFNLDRGQIMEFADGVVAATGYNDEERPGWYWADLMIWDKETQENIEDNGFSVSNAYDVLEADRTGGTWHNVPYDEVVVKGAYDHMAVVPNPRYEGASIRKNSKPGGKTVFKRKAKNMEPPKEPETQEVENQEEVSGFVEINGEKIPMSEIVAKYREMKTGELENGGDVFNMEDVVEVDGEELSVEDMVNACGYATKENAEPPTDTPAEEVVDETAQRSNSAPKAPVSKKPNEAFKKVKNSVNRESAPFKRDLNTEASRIEKGKNRYGAKVPQGGK